MFEDLGNIGAALGDAAKAAGKGTAKIITNVGNFASKHPVASSRLYGGAKILQGIKDLKDFKETRQKGSLITGLAQIILGGALVIYNDRSWYEKIKKISPALNSGRPMNPLLLKDFTKDPTMAGITKFVDIEMDWDTLEGSLIFDAISVQIMKAIREELKSNLVYSDTLIRQYLNDAINLTIWMLQIQTQMSWRDLAVSDNPTAYNLVNKIARDSSTYGPVALDVLELYSSDVDSDVFATTIAQYDTAVSYLNNNSIYLPGNVPEFLNFYFGNVYTTDDDGSNTQLMFPRVRRIRLWNEDNTQLQEVDITQLDPAQLLTYVKAFASKYAILMADLTKTTTFRAVGFLPYEYLTESAVYSQEFLQMIINAYTDKSALLNNGFIRLDYLDLNVDLLTTFMATRPLLDEKSPLYTPNIRIKSMVAKFESDQDLAWDKDLFQGPFDTSKDFGISICSYISKDVYVTLTSTSTELVTGTGVIDYTGDLTPNQFSISFANSSNSISGTADKVPGYSGPIGDSTHILYPIATMAVGNTDSDSRVIYIAANANDSSLPTLVKLCPLSDYLSYTGLSSGNANKPMLAQGFPNNSISLTVTGTPFSNESMDVSFYVNLMPGNFKFTGDNNSRYLLFASFINSNMSYTSMSMIFSETVDNSVSVVNGFVNLDSFMADQLDYHIPMVVDSKVHIQLNDEPESVVSTGKSLIKENYIPFMYNITDLSPVLYDMFFSLFILNRSSSQTSNVNANNKSGNKDSKRGNRNKNKGKSGKSQSKGKSDKDKHDDWPQDK